VIHFLSAKVGAVGSSGFAIGGGEGEGAFAGADPNGDSLGGHGVIIHGGDSSREKGIVSQTIQVFFEEFQRCNADEDAEQLSRLYAPVFLMAGASGVQAVRSADLALAIPKPRQMLRSIGCMPAGLFSLEETKLDDRYSMARAKWQWRTERGGTAEEITMGLR